MSYLELNIFFFFNKKVEELGGHTRNFFNKKTLHREKNFPKIYYNYAFQRSSKNFMNKFVDFTQLKPRPSIIAIKMIKKILRSSFFL
jgi:hypothetical protein